MSAYREPASAADIERSAREPEFYVFAGGEQKCPGCGTCVSRPDPYDYHGSPRQLIIRAGVSRTWKPRRWFRRVAHYAWRCQCGYRWRELPKGRES